MTIRLGILGLSPGNGHPFSWSAIFNGYNPVEMEHCGFPLIPRYLEKQTWPDDRIPGASVTHVWTEDADISCKISRAALIPNVVTEPIDMIGEVDAVLLARDDAQNHIRLARPFLEHGLPVYVDKPAATSLSDLDLLFAMAKREQQIFSCSALRFAEEMFLTGEERLKIGEIRRIIAISPNSWATYSPHIIDPVLAQFPELEAPSQVASLRTGQLTTVAVSAGSGLEAIFTTVGDCPCRLSISYFGKRGQVEKVHTDSFSAFKRALEEFLDSVHGTGPGTPLKQVRPVISFIEAGMP
jgi:hypothetical protein